MKKVIFTYFKFRRNATVLLLGLAILITGFTSVSPPVVELAECTSPINSPCTGNVPIQNLANGMDYTITVGAGGTVNITVRVVDNPAGLVGFLGGPGNPISFPNGTGTFTYSLTNQPDPYVLNMYFNWAAGGQGSSTPVSCSASVAPTVCMGNVPIQNLANGMDYTITVGAGGTVGITVRVVDNPAGLVGFLGGPGNPISFPNGTGTFTYSLTNQADPYVLNMYFNWAAGGQGSSTPVSCSSSPPPPPPVPPSQPVGFVAINPTSSSAFLAVGPNNVGANNIVYRLFYSPTASAPANPLNATQHTFGSIPGDGNGVSPFGFNRGGLTAATPYTFWLYQYNTVSMLYSTPAVATLTTLSPPLLPTTSPPNPTCPAANVVSIYGDFYSPNIATNYNPNWGQTGFCCVNPAYNPGTGNVIMAYTNFNYQGTEVTQTNLSNMQFLNFDVWTDANPSATTLQVSPINQGTGPAEVLVTVPYVRGQWTRISLPKSAFGGMTWDAVFQMKFAANGPGSLVPVDIYLDNIFFSSTNCAGGPPPMVNCSNQTVTFNGQNTIALVASQLATTSNATLSLNPSFVTCDQVGLSVPVTVTATNASNNTATCTSNITVAGLPCGWSQNANGVNCANGNSIAYNSGTGEWTVTSTNCLYGPPFTSDATAFAQRTLCGNGSITAQVTSISGTSFGWAGVIMRESNMAGAKKAQLMTNLSNFSRREFRTTPNGAANPQQFSSQNRYWLRLVRTGIQFSMYVSPDGADWYLVGAQSIQMNACIQMGLVATNYQQTSTVTATFDNVSFSGANTATEGLQLGGLEGSIEPYGFEAYPNPTLGELNVNLAQYLGRTVQVELYSLTGELLRRVEIEEVQTSTEQLDLSALQSGMYLIKVKTDGLPDATRRVVLAR